MSGLFEGIELAWPWVLWAWPLPLLLHLLLPRARSQRGGALRVPFYGRLGPLLSAGGRSPPSRLRWLLMLLLWSLLVLAAARPITLGEPVALPQSGRDLMLAVDLSKSMEIEDMVIGGQAVNRLDALKVLLGDFIARRDGDRLGLILFGRNAYLQSPFTFDHQTLRQLLLETVIGLVGPETAIGDAIGLAVKHLREQPAEQRVLILVTDGANTAGNIEPGRAAELAQQAGVRIHTIGIGADRMVQRSLFGDRIVNPSADLDEDSLRRIAELTGGRYFRARDSAELARIYAEIDEIEPLPQDDQVLRPVIERYPWPLGLAVLLTVLAALAGALRQRWPNAPSPTPGTIR
ncbi:MAG: VWA domain-containing protein [Xanthomonadales bacterium]|nr:VWA domain-containing protein [Xanthomonadales bacterium]